MCVCISMRHSTCVELKGQLQGADFSFHHVGFQRTQVIQFAGMAPCNSSPSLKKQVSCECVCAHLPWPGTCVEVTEQLAEVWFVQGLNSGVRPGRWHPTSSHFSVYGFSNVKHVYWLSSVNNEKSVILSHTGYVFKLRLCFLSALVVRIVFFFFFKLGQDAV